jgi:hypothetical protein
MFVPHPTAEDFPAIMGQPSESTAGKSAPRGLGDMVAAGLDAIGITKARAQAVASAFGVSDCGCAARQEALNRAFPFGPRPPENPPPATIDQSGEAAGPR